MCKFTTIIEGMDKGGNMLKPYFNLLLESPVCVLSFDQNLNLDVRRHDFNTTLNWILNWDTHKSDSCDNSCSEKKGPW